MAESAIIGGRMPSPIGHLITGAAIGRAVTPDKPRVVAWCAVLAAASDLDLLFPGTHRTVTHSLGAVIAVTAVTVVTIISIVVTGKVTGVRPRVRSGVRPRVRYLIAVALILAFASHLVLDWLGADPTPPNGLQLFWPFSDRWYISGLDIFRGTARRNIFTAHSMWINATALAQEIAITLPIAWVVFRRRSAAARSFGHSKFSKSEIQ
jgi:membrane-bound metal-dependent hydrolase YbcI (DUF457 family)